MAVLEEDLGRRRHFGEFYGLSAVPKGDGPLIVVHGNCQAEAVRVAIGAATAGVRSVRMPPVHEIESSDLPHLERLLAQVDVIASQPVEPDYRGLPIGTEQLARLAPAAQIVRWPVVRYVGLHPFAALIRTPWRGDPPVVPYHDLRTIVAHVRGLPAAERPLGSGRPEGFRAVAAASIAELRRRESAGGLVAVSDLLEAAGADAMHTINHPGNAVLVPLAGRILTAAGVESEPLDPGRTLLPSILAPVDPRVLAALELPAAAARATWSTPDGTIDDAAVAAGQIEWYSTRPEIVSAALQRYGPAIEQLGL